MSDKGAWKARASEMESSIPGNTFSREAWQ